MRSRPATFLPLLLALAGSCCLHPANAASATLPDDFVAILRRGDPTEIRQALDHGAPLEGRDAEGNTPLILASGYAGAPAVKALLDQGAIVNATNGAGATALIRGATRPELVRLLLDRGAQADLRSHVGNSALIIAARGANSHGTVQLLLEHGASATASNRFGATALMAAVAGRDEASVRLLLQHGAKPNTTPTADPPGFIIGGGRTPLMWAAYRGDLVLLRDLFAAGADPNLFTGIGTPLSQAAWNDHVEATRLLLEHGAKPNTLGIGDGYAALHWAASTEHANPRLVQLLLAHGADPNLGGGEPVDAFRGTPQTPLMLARRRGNTSVVDALIAGGATQATPDRVRTLDAAPRAVPAELTPEVLRAAAQEAAPPLLATGLESKRAFLRHASHQDCTSCHQQHLPLAALSSARKLQARVDPADYASLVHLVQEGDLKDPELDWQPVFHPEPALSKGYEILGYALAGLPADARTDAWVNQLAAIQDRDGSWPINLPRPPIQTTDLGGTALAVHALQRYPLPGRAEEFAERVRRARRWLWKARPDENDSRIYQLLGLAWAGEPAGNLQPLAEALIATQRADGGWAQLPGLDSDAFATGQAVYALRVGAGRAISDPAVQRGLRFLLRTQLPDGTWHVRRRAFPFQPTMDSGFPHGRDSWISAAATSWAVLALAGEQG